MSAGGLRKLTADEELSVRAQSQDLLDVAEKAVAIKQSGDEASCLARVLLPHHEPPGA